MATAYPLGAASGAAGDFEIDPSALSYRIAEAVKRQILCGQMPAGQRLSLDDLALHFRVSVTPVRDALRLLTAEGLVELRDRRGAFVVQPSAEDIRNTFQIREILECAAVESVLALGAPIIAALQAIIDEIAPMTCDDSHPDYLAYIRLDQRFHQSLVSCLDNRKLFDLYEGLHAFTLATLVLARETEQRASATLHEHQAIVDALRRGDAEAMRAAIRTHLRNAGADLLKRAEHDHSTLSGPRGEQGEK